MEAVDVLGLDADVEAATYEVGLEAVVEQRVITDVRSIAFAV